MFRGFHRAGAGNGQTTLQGFLVSDATELEPGPSRHRQGREGKGGGEKGEKRKEKKGLRGSAMEGRGDSNRLAVTPLSTTQTSAIP